MVIICAVHLACGGDFGVHRCVVLGNGGLGGFLERSDNSRTGQDVCICDFGPESDTVVARRVLLLYSFYEDMLGSANPG